MAILYHRSDITDSFSVRTVVEILLDERFYIMLWQGVYWD